MTRPRPPLLLIALLGYMVGRAVGGSAGAQEPEWSSLRLIADPAIVGAVARAVRFPDGTVSRDREQIAYIGAQDEERVADVVLDPGYQYVVGCTFNFNDDVEYDVDLFLPLTLRPRVKR